MRWPWQRNSVPRCRFAIVFPGRTGSSFLVSCLRSHPAVHVEGEQLVRQDAAWQRRYLHSLYGDARPAPVIATGFKTKPKDVWDLGGFAQVLAELDVRVIALSRRNLVKLAVSTLNARRLHESTGRWNRTAETPAPGPLAVSAEELAATIDRCAAAQAEVHGFASSCGRPVLHLDYEDLLLDRGRWIGSVLDFLELPKRELAGEVEKSTADDLRVALADFEGLRAHFRGTAREADFLT